MSALNVLRPFNEVPAPRQAPVELPELVRAAQGVLTQGLELLFNLGDKTYSHIVGTPYNASIGQHYRHVLEHFVCLVKGFPAGEINYDARQRNPRIESEVSYASVATCDVLRIIKHYREEELARECKVLQSVSYGSAGPSAIGSNIGRELAYCAGHAIHHYAIVRLICNQLGMDVPSEFGFAPSTLKRMSTLATD